MRHQYTPKQIADATVVASTLHPELRGLDIPPVKAILTALPDHPGPEEHPHPDPAEHPIIMEQGGKGWVWNAQHEMYYQPHSTEYRFPEGFTEWFPAQINSDEPAEAPR